MKYVSDSNLAERYGVSRPTIWRWAKAGRLPAPVQLSPGCTRWIADEISAKDDEWKAKRRQPKAA